MPFERSVKTSYFVIKPTFQGMFVRKREKKPETKKKKSNPTLIDK